MNRMCSGAATLLLGLACVLPATADYEGGREAWAAGEQGEAMVQWRESAEDGDPRSMLALGLLYEQGLGAPQDFIEAYKWFSLAASYGELAGPNARDKLAGKMTPNQIATAQTLTRDWSPGAEGGAASPVLRGGGLGSHQVGEYFRDCADCPQLVVVPGGPFGNPFAVGVYETTFYEWDVCVQGEGCNGYQPKDEGWGRGSRPVVNVAYNDAKAYTQWLSEETGQEYRLLTEAEWEYVARAGAATEYWWGSLHGANRANCRGCGSRWDGKLTAPVGSFEANPFGLFDVHGNVFEWTEGCYKGDCNKRVLRGGSVHFEPHFAKADFQYGDAVDIRFNCHGFRVARVLTP